MSIRSTADLEQRIEFKTRELAKAEDLVNRVMKGESVKLCSGASVRDLDKDVLRLRAELAKLQKKRRERMR